MPTQTDVRITALAEACVDEMGDIFWDYDVGRDAPSGYTEPTEVATEAVKRVLAQYAQMVDPGGVYPSSLREEYATLVEGLGPDPEPNAVISALVAEADWTEQGATTVAWLASEFGTSILRNALALAEAQGIEDGSCGL